MQRGEDLLIRVKPLGGREAVIDLRPLFTTPGWWDGDPNSRTWWELGDGSHLIVTVDDRWVQLVIDWLAFWQRLVKNDPPRFDRDARERTEGEAAALLRRDGYPLPDRLKGIALPADRIEVPDEPQAIPDPALLVPPPSLSSGTSAPQPEGAGSTAGQIDAIAIADALAARGYTLEAAIVRHFKRRQTTTKEELVDAVCPGEEREWATVKTWVNRVKNALLDLDPPCGLSFSTTIRGYLIIKNPPVE
jgi:hypothetical protein